MKRVVLAAAAVSMAFGSAASASEPLRASQAVPAATKVANEAPVKRAAKRSETKMNLNAAAGILAGVTLGMVALAAWAASESNG